MEFLALIVVGVVVYLVVKGRRKPPPAARRASPVSARAARETGTPDTPGAGANRTAERKSRTIAGKAWVADGDGLRVAGEEIRLAGIDAPEHEQPAKGPDGAWFDHGARVKSALIRKVGGKPVRVEAVGTDKFGRTLGVVTHDGQDINEWLVRYGHAIAAYDNRYRGIQREARAARRGMWGCAIAYDPRAWRHDEIRRLF